MDKATFEEHISKEHRISPFSAYIKEFVYGGNDGIVTTFAVVAGFSGANLGEHTLNLSLITVLLFGVANLLADGAAMGLGSFLSVRSHHKLYETAYNQERSEIVHSREYEIEETEYLFKEQGFNEADSKELTRIVSKNPDYWAKFMVQYECEIEDPENTSAFYNGLATFSSFVFFGAIPLIPYLFSLTIQASFVYSSVMTVLALMLLGLLRAVVTKEKLMICIVETVIVGGSAAILAYIVGAAFRFM